MADACLRGEMNDMRDFIAQQNEADKVAIANISGQNFDVGFGKPIASIALQLRIVIGVEIVDANDEIIALFEGKSQVVANEPGSSCD